MATISYLGLTEGSMANFKSTNFAHQSLKKVLHLLHLCSKLRAEALDLLSSLLSQKRGLLPRGLLNGLGCRGENRCARRVCPWAWGLGLRKWGRGGSCSIRGPGNRGASFTIMKW